MSYISLVWINTWNKTSIKGIKEYLKNKSKRSFCHFQSHGPLLTVQRISGEWQRRISSTRTRVPSLIPGGFPLPWHFLLHNVSASHRVLCIFVFDCCVFNATGWISSFEAPGARRALWCNRTRRHGEERSPGRICSFQLLPTQNTQTEVWCSSRCKYHRFTKCCCSLTLFPELQSDSHSCLNWRNHKTWPSRPFSGLLWCKVQFYLDVFLEAIHRSKWKLLLTTCFYHFMGIFAFRHHVAQKPRKLSHVVFNSYFSRWMWDVHVTHFYTSGSTRSNHRNDSSNLWKSCVRRNCKVTQKQQGLLFLRYCRDLRATDRKWL